MIEAAGVIVLAAFILGLFSFAKDYPKGYRFAFLIICAAVLAFIFGYMGWILGIKESYSTITEIEGDTVSKVAIENSLMSLIEGFHLIIIGIIATALFIVGLLFVPKLFHLDKR